MPRKANGQIIAHAPEAVKHKGLVYDVSVYIKKPDQLATILGRKAAQSKRGSTKLCFGHIVCIVTPTKL